MASEQSEVDICNMALDLLEEVPIVTLDDDTKSARWMKRNYAITRDAILRLHPWNFATTRTELLADSTAPDFGWDYRYAIPADALRMLPLTDDGELNGAYVDHEIEGGYLLTDKSAPLKVRYVCRKTNPGSFDVLFIEALAAGLAAKSAHLLTGKTSQTSGATRAYRQALFDARVLDGLEGTPESTRDNAVIDARL